MMNTNSANNSHKEETLGHPIPMSYIVVDETLCVCSVDDTGTLNDLLGGCPKAGQILCSYLRCCPNTTHNGSCPIKHAIDTLIATKLRQEVIVTTKSDTDESEHRLIVTAILLPMRNEWRILLCLQDVTTWHKVNEALQRAERFSALGTLAGGIAHDFNNHLTTIIGKLSLLRAKGMAEEGDDDQLRDVLEVSFHAAELATELLTFAAGGAPLQAAVEVEQVVDEAIARAMLRFRTQVEFDRTSPMPLISADAAQIRQAISNVLVNAAEAMDGGGRIYVNLSTFEQRGTTPSPTLSPGTYVEIRLRDEGPGVSVRDLARIFDPYFTTKQGAHGLGLTAAYSILQRHGGELRVNSRGCHGTTVSLALPIWVERERCAGSADTLPRREDSILIMDDDEDLRLALSEMLEFLGWHVTAVADGEAAIAAYRHSLAEGAAFSVVMLDLLVIDGMGGAETITRLIELDPHVRAVVSSGYSNDPVMANYEEYCFRAALPKPYSLLELDQLLKRVRSRE